MSEVLKINGEQYVPSKVAAERVGYTGDYVARLAREEKVAASKVGKTWFVALRSVEDFCKYAEKEKQAKRHALSAQRKKDIKTSEKANGKTKSHHTVRGVQPHQEEKAITRGRSHALLETLAILMLGIFFGTSGYFVLKEDVLADVGEMRTDSFEQLALTVYEMLTPDSSPFAYERTVAGNEAPSDDSKAKADEQPDAAVAVTPREQFANVVENSFSDDVDVEVDADAPNVATVFPVFDERAQQGYEFVLLPIAGSETVDAEFYERLLSSMGTTSEVQRQIKK